MCFVSVIIVLLFTLQNGIETDSLLSSWLGKQCCLSDDREGTFERLGWCVVPQGKRLSFHQEVILDFKIVFAARTLEMNTNNILTRLGKYYWWRMILICFSD